ncbi:flagellar export protein FliJ [Virgibacillus byunsanensis]|uniref:Flagellar FliJ protein n=1 Tax=Virgibacillus byunsanensis TaxID=570945 RepID=A0ABW3LHW2_9BACI
MAETMALSKILHIRENEKKNAQRVYHQSIEFFENIATQLYNLLKKKEAAEDSYELYLKETTPIDKIKEQVIYIELLNNQIMSLQNDVQKARTDMENNQEKLTSAFVEVKKFEKIIEYRHKEKEEMIKKNDNALMDETSIQQYLSQKHR